MSRRPKARNPFYALLVIVGTMFAVTAFAYGVMSFRAIRATSGQAVHPLLEWLQRHGDAAMLVELGLLGVLTFAAIATDGYWEKRAASRDRPSSSCG